MVMAKSDPARINILLIEDRPEGVYVTKRALENAGVRCRFHTVGSGSSTFDYLRQVGSYKDVPTPDLIFLDLSSPSDKCISLLKKIKADEEISKIPIVVLSGPESEQKLNNAYKATGEFICFTPIDLDAFLGAIKSLRLDRFLHAIQLIDKFGFVLAKMPDEDLDESHGRMAIA